MTHDIKKVYFCSVKKYKIEPIKNIMRRHEKV